MTIVDPAGDIIVQKRMDGCASKGIPQFSYAKAYTCIAMKISSRDFSEKYTSSG